jgi:hypothetical protein
MGLRRRLLHLCANGALPVKNYTTDLYPEHEKMNGQYMRTHYKLRPVPAISAASPT